MQDQEQETKELEAGRCTGEKDGLNCSLKYGCALNAYFVYSCQIPVFKAQKCLPLALVTSDTTGTGQKNCMPQRGKSADCDSGVYGGRQG